jgi:hypothetical protein
MKRLHSLALAAAVATVVGGVVIQSLADVGTAPSASGSKEDHEHQFSPRQQCVEEYAHKAGHLAYLEAKLDLNADQKALWAKWSQATIAGADGMRAQCMAQSPASDTNLNALQREAFAETMLTLEVSNLKSARPSLEALYAALTPEQKALFDHQGDEHRHHRSHHDSDEGEHDVL